MQVLGIDTSLVDLDYLLLRRPTVRSPDGERINLKLATADGNGLFFKCSMDTQLAHLMHAWCHRNAVGIETVRFVFQGHHLNESDTPFIRDMEDGDVIDVMVESDDMSDTSSTESDDAPEFPEVFAWMDA